VRARERESGKPGERKAREREELRGRKVQGERAKNREGAVSENNRCGSVILSEAKNLFRICGNLFFKLALKQEGLNLSGSGKSFHRTTDQR
jgi:hypothetical protein